MKEKKDEPKNENIDQFSERMGGKVLAEKAAAKQKAGEFRLVKEFETKPFDAITFEVDKGQSFRFELLEGNQILDIQIINRHNPIHEYASQYNTTSIQGHGPKVGYTFVSQSPFWRPMATVIADTVDLERLAERTGHPHIQHFYYTSNFRCSEGDAELTSGVPNINSCNSNLIKAYYELGGDELMMAHRHGEIFCPFQPMTWDMVDGSPLLRYWPSNGGIQSGDYVELIAQQDLIVIVSSCPHGNQEVTSNARACHSWPCAVKIYDTGIDLPDVEPLKSMHAIEFVKAGRPGMVNGKLGVPGGEGSFVWQEAQAAKKKGL